MPVSNTAPPAIKVLVVDDEPDLRTVYELTLLREGYRVETAENLAQAWAHLERERFDLVITDMRLPDGLGLELLQGLAQRRRPERAIVITAYGSAENAVESLKAGAFDYLTKPVDLKQFRAVVASAIRGVAAPAPRGPAAQEGRTAPRAASGASALEKMVGNSDVMRAVKERIVKIARSMAPVLVRGESGTGKELVARAIHDCSHRASQAFVAVNCSAIPESLLEAEFFGAKKGSYTGATQDRAGYFQAASGGTLFLDEIGDLPLAMQSKLLRAIQERSVRPLGSTQEDQVDVRIVSATHKDLAAEVQAQQFRQDLFYRLNVIEILIPPLRERREDLPALCAALLERIAHESGMPVPVLSPEVVERLCMLRLSGNVRELENLLHRAVALSDGSALHVDFAPTQATTLEEAFGTSSPDATPAQATLLPDDLQRYLDQLEREVLVRALREHRFNRTTAAASMGLNLRQMRYRMARLNIQAPRDDDGRDDSA
jgi:two-component system response regulator PilR (NtrC family)